MKAGAFFFFWRNNPVGSNGRACEKGKISTRSGPTTHPFFVRGPTASCAARHDRARARAITGNPARPPEVAATNRGCTPRPGPTRDVMVDLAASPPSLRT